MAKIRHASIFLGGKRLAWMQSADESIETGDTLEVTDGGVHPTDGTIMGSVTANVLVPVAGTSTGIVEKALRHEDLKIGFGIVDGKIHQYPARAKSLKFSSDVAAGKLTGVFEFMIYDVKVTG